MKKLKFHFIFCLGHEGKLRDSILISLDRLIYPWVSWRLDVPGGSAFRSLTYPFVFFGHCGITPLCMQNVLLFIANKVKNEVYEC